MTEQLFFKQYSQLPDSLKQELQAFLDFLVFKYQTWRAAETQKPVLTESRTPQKKAPKAGFLKGTFVMSPDFDEPLEDFKDYMA